LNSSSQKVAARLNLSLSLSKIVTDTDAMYGTVPEFSWTTQLVYTANCSITTSNWVMSILVLTLRPWTYQVDRSTRGHQCRQGATSLLVVVVDVAATALEHRRSAASSAVLRPDQHPPATRLQSAAARRPRAQFGDHAVLRARQSAESLSRRWIVVDRQLTGVSRSRR